MCNYNIRVVTQLSIFPLKGEPGKQRRRWECRYQPQTPRLRAGTCFSFWVNFQCDLRCYGFSYPRIKKTLIIFLVSHAGQMRRIPTRTVLVNKSSSPWSLGFYSKRSSPHPKSWTTATSILSSKPLFELKRNVHSAVSGQPSWWKSTASTFLSLRWWTW